MSFRHPRCREFCDAPQTWFLLGLCCGLVGFIIFSVCQAVKL
jgi:hypothetical protein